MRLVEHTATAKAPADWFTGDVWWDVIHGGHEPSRMRVNLVRFAPGARTNWHTHAMGQTLHVVSGVALVGTRDGTIIEAHPGETVTCPPGEEHWLGATPDREGIGDGTPETAWADPSSTSATTGLVSTPADLATGVPSAPT